MSNRLRHCKKTQPRIGAAIVISVLVVIVICALTIAIVIISKSYNKKSEPKKTETQIATETEIVITVATEQVTEKETTVAIEQIVQEDSENFKFVMEESNYSSEDISAEQLIVVDTYSSTADVYCFEKTQTGWKDIAGIEKVKGYVGTQGISIHANEYESYTPAGLFGIGTGFGICDDPGTGLDYFKVTNDSYWVDDVNSKYYNQHIEGTQNRDWTSAEHLIDYSGSYNYCAFIEYNSDPAVPGKGSAFFLHVGSSPTAGCVAVSENAMINILKWLKKEKQPQILIY